MLLPDLPRVEFGTVDGASELAGAEWLVDAEFFPTAPLVTHYEIDAQPGAFALIGQPALAARVGIASNGAISLVGQAATFSRSAVASGAAFALMGESAGLQRNAALSAQSAVFAVSGQPATFAVGRSLNAQPATVAVSGRPSTVIANRALTAIATSLSAVGQPATVKVARALNAQGATVVVTGLNAELLIAVPNRVIAADAGVFATVGQSASVLRGGLSLNAEPTVFNVSGAPTTRSLTFRADARTVQIAGADASLLRGYALITTDDKTGYASDYANGYDGPDSDYRIGYKYADGYTFNYVGDKASASFLLGRVRASSAGAFAMVGGDSDYAITQTPRLIAEAGIFTVDGTARFLLEADMLTSTPLSTEEKQEIANMAAAAVIAALGSEVRTALAPELARIDVRVGSRASQADVFAAG